MAQLARDTFTPAITLYELLASHSGEDAEWRYPDDLAPLSGYCETLVGPNGTIFRSGYSTGTGSNQTFDSLTFLDGSNLDFSATAVEIDFLNVGDYISTQDGGAAEDRPVAEGQGLGFEFMGPGGTDPVDTKGWLVNDTGVNNNPASGSNSIAEIFFAFDDGSLTGYGLSYNRTNGEFKLMEYAGNLTGTLLATISTSITTGTSARVKITRQTPSLKVYVNGTLAATVSDATSNTGLIGFRFSGGSSPAAGMHLDNLTAYDEAVIVVPPAAPVLTAVAGTGLAETSWTSVALADSYRLYRSDSATGVFEIIAEPTTTAYTDTGLVIGTYAYKVSAVIDGVEGSFSNIEVIYVATSTTSGDQDTPSTVAQRPMRKYDPLDYNDKMAGKICSISGLWYPGSKLVWKRGMPIGIDFAHLELPGERAQEIEDW